MMKLQPASKLMGSLKKTTSLLQSFEKESDLSMEEQQAAVQVYQELQRLLSLSTRTGDWTFRVNKLQHNSPQDEFHQIYTTMVEEFDQAAHEMSNIWLNNPAAVRPLGRESLAEVRDFFILDNSLRETTVGAARGHTLDSKNKILDSIAASGLEEVILGAFGSKISVDSQTASKWRSLGRSFDRTWGFSFLYDFTPIDEPPVVRSYMKFVHNLDTKRAIPGNEDFMVPYKEPLLTYSKEDLQLFRKAFLDFPEGAFNGKSPKEVLKESEHEMGRIPMGLLMMAGYGICNAIIEVEIVYESFPHDRYDNAERLRYLIQWCKKNFPMHKNENGELESARCMVNFTDFPMWKNSIQGGGLEKAMYTIYKLSSLPPNQRPFAYGMEDPTCWLMPDEVGKFTRMIKYVMAKVGHADGKFLVHVHKYFGTAEASTLACIANGADGVWAAMCTVGAQVGHACSTLTATNLVRLGNVHLCEKFDLGRMCKAAREIHEVTTGKPCPTHEEGYGIDAFDYPFSMLAIPYCRHALIALIKNLGIDVRLVRVNELVSVMEVQMAMEQTFGPPRTSGWDPKHCTKMWEALHNHMLSGLSRDYNTAVGLGHLYSLISRKKLPEGMVRIMLEHTSVSDTHPTVIEFISRWNRLCARFQGEELPLPGTLAPSCLNYSQDITLSPRLRYLPFSVWLKDVMVDNFLMKPIPKIFKRTVMSLMMKQEAKYQGVKNPELDFYHEVLQLMLFIQEAEGIGVLPLVDDFSIRKNHAFMFGDDHNWLREVTGERPRKANQLLRTHIDFAPRFYAGYGNNNIIRCCRAAAKRVTDNKAISDDLLWLREGNDGQAVEEVAGELEMAEDMKVSNTFSEENFLKRFLHQTKRNVKLATIAEDSVPAKAPNTLDVDDLPDDEEEGGSRAFYMRMHDIIANDEGEEEIGDDLSAFLTPSDDKNYVSPFVSSKKPNNAKKKRGKVFKFLKFPHRNKETDGERRSVEVPRATNL